MVLWLGLFSFTVGDCYNIPISTYTGYCSAKIFNTLKKEKERTLSLGGILAFSQLQNDTSLTLINPVRCYIGNTAWNYYFLIFCCLFSTISFKISAAKSIPFDVLHYVMNVLLFQLLTQGCPNSGGSHHRIQNLQYTYCMQCRFYGCQTLGIFS